MAEAKPKERTVLNVSVSITDTDVFEHVLAIWELFIAIPRTRT